MKKNLLFPVFNALSKTFHWLELIDVSREPLWLLPAGAVLLVCRTECRELCPEIFSCLEVS